VNGQPPVNLLFFTKLVKKFIFTENVGDRRGHKSIVFDQKFQLNHVERVK